MLRISSFVPLLLIICCIACSTHQEVNPNAIFKKLSGSETGINFQNTLTELKDFDVFRYRNFYNGGGVAIGDINDDGLADLFVTSNMGDNKLFLNKGNWRFEDITSKAGVAGKKVWSTGVSFADVNADGRLDIYVCNAGDVNGGNRENELFINNGDLTFTERADEFGLADMGFTTHAAFFDYDRDGDLDCYVLNNSYRPVASLGYRNLRNERDEFGGHKLYRNDNGHFFDVSQSAGIYGSVIGFGLGVTVGDVNQDFWPDLYISNDFYERDYLYINNHNGTFTESLENYMGHISMFSMGADLSDINNDGYPDIFSTDMLPADDYRLKTLTSFETYDTYQLRVNNGYYHQFMRNMLHLNNKDGTFSEIGQLANVAASDWSWGVLMADFNNDAFKEIFVSNGIYKDVINQDFVEYLGGSEQMRAAIEGKQIDFKAFVNQMPSTKLSNYLFVLQGDYQYRNMSHEWGLDEPSFSNGAAYGDFDNDGDLDLVVNNVNQEIFVYQNQARQQNKNNYVAITFKGPDKNSFALGASVTVFVGGMKLCYDHMPIRGFQSSMDYKMTIGIGSNTSIDSLLVVWPDEKTQILHSVVCNKILTLNYADASNRPRSVEKPDPLLAEAQTTQIYHHENPYNDFDRDRLSYHMLSTQGPGFAVGDINNDGLDDLFLGSSVGKSSRFYLQKNDNSFMATADDLFAPDSAAEDVDAIFFDADGDADSDLFVVTGGSENTGHSIHTLDRLYFNEGVKNGLPIFRRSLEGLPQIYQSGSCARAADFDMDGDLDLFVGTRVLPSYYGVPCDQYLLVNDGKGHFTDETVAVAQQFKKLGMVTDAVWFDYDHDKFPDLMVVGEWMKPTIFANDGKHLKKIEEIPGLEKTNGWWNSITKADIDRDGDDDFVVGNLGLNSKFKPTKESPIKLYVNDFDENGSVEPIFTYQQNGREVPMALRQDIIKQMSSLKKKFIYYKDYADKSFSDIFSSKLTNQAEQFEFYLPHTSVLLNNDRSFEIKPLPVEAQFAPVYSILVDDFNGDQYPDLLLGGNLFAVKPEAGRYDALHGLMLAGSANGVFTPLSSLQSGILVEGETRHIAKVKTKGKPFYFFVRNNDKAKIFRKKK